MRYTNDANQEYQYRRVPLWGGSRVGEEGGGGHILNQLFVHDITGDIKCIIVVHGNVNAC